MITENENDKILWKIAKKRVAFKKQLGSYIIINLFLWAIWYVTLGRKMEEFEIWAAWPVWCTLGWGIGLAFGYLDAYHSNCHHEVEMEFQKLKENK